MRGGLLLALFAVSGAVPAPAWAALSIIETSGVVQTRRDLSGPWLVPERLPAALKPGDQLRTGLKAAATLRFEDGSTVFLGADATLALEEDAPGRSSLRLYLGRISAWVRPSAKRRFEVRTPTAACTVRGTEFDVAVYSGGRTVIDLHSGLLGVEDNRGGQVLLHGNESLVVDRGGMGAPARVPTAGETRRRGVRETLRRELGFDRAREESLDAAGREIKLAEYQLGKARIDVNGMRVRVEEYVLRPASDRFKFVSLSKRGGRLDYFYYQGTFNTSLPADLSVALRDLGGAADVAPAYFLTAFETGRSNRTDTVREAGQGGHPVDVNSNADASDDVGSLFDASTGRFLDVTGRAVFKTLFDRYGFYLNGKLKHGRAGAAITSESDAAASSNTDPLSGAALSAADAWLDGTGFLPVRTVNVTYPDQDRLRQRVYESYSDGTFIAWDNYLLDEWGRAAGFPGAASAAGFRGGLLGYGFEQVLTASELSGRRIDLMMTPKILLQTGGIR